MIGVVVAMVICYVNLHCEITLNQGYVSTSDHKTLAPHDRTYGRGPYVHLILICKVPSC